MRSVLVVWLLVLGAVSSSEPSSEVVLLGEEPPPPDHERTLAASTMAVPKVDPQLGDSISAAGTFSYTVGSAKTDLGETGQPEGARVTEKEIAEALRLGKSDEADMPSPVRVKSMLAALQTRVDTVCDEAERAPMRVADLERQKVQAYGAMQKAVVDKQASDESMGADEKARLQAKVGRAYVQVSDEYETAQKEQSAMESKCRVTKKKLFDLTAVAERIRASKLSDVNLPNSAYSFSQLELGAMPICQKILGEKGFQAWLSSTYVKDLELQQKETACWAGQVVIREYEAKILRDSLASGSSSARMVQKGLRCIVEPLVQRLFKSVAGTEHTGNQDDIQDFVAAIEASNRTELGATADSDAATVDLSLLQLGEAKVSLNATHAIKGNVATKLSPGTKKQLPPAVKYECLYTQYRKETGAWATGKAAIEENAKLELETIRKMTTSEPGTAPPMLGEGEDGRCSDFLTKFFQPTPSQNIMQDIQEKLQAGPPAPGVREEKAVAAEKQETASKLKRKLQKFIKEMKDVIVRQAKEHVGGIERKLAAATEHLQRDKVKMQNSQSQEEAIQETRGTDDKLFAGECLGSACYVGSKIKTKAIGPFANPASVEYQDMTWFCRRNADSVDLTQNSFVCTAEEKGKGSVACSGKEVRIGEDWIPFLKQTNCQNQTCQDLKQCSSSKIQVMTNNAEKVLQWNCMSL